MFGVSQMVLIYLFIYLERKRCIKLIKSDSEDFIMYHSFHKNIKQHKCIQTIQQFITKINYILKYIQIENHYYKL